MASNSFGRKFRITTWGESHGKAIGVVIDGCPAGIELCEEEINSVLALRAPGRNAHVSPRKETDRVEILSGIFDGLTTGAPISLMIQNRDADPSRYEPIKENLRPGHANYTYLQKYGIFDYRGGGRASARETACRVAAGAVAKKVVKNAGIETVAYIRSIGEVEADIPFFSIEQMKSAVYGNDLFCPDENNAKKMAELIERTKESGDSLGGIVEFFADPMPVGLGDPVYQKMEALLAQAMLSIPATKGFEMGDGFAMSRMVGSRSNDLFEKVENKIRTKTNRAGGTLGGISSGMPLIGRVAFKPTSSILQPQETVNTSGKNVVHQLPEGSRHDPCVAIRGVPVVDAMLSLVLADYLVQR